MRRVVTAADENGRSFVAIDEELDDPTFGLEVWRSDPDVPRPWLASIDPAEVPDFEPPAGGSHAMVVRIGPGDEGVPATPIPGVDADGVHVTRTVDYIVMLEGAIDLDLDAGTVTLKAGDFAIQRATNHAWHNRTDAPAAFFAVLTSLVGP